jgi:hypothetical protein
MPPTSKAQARFMRAVASGDAKAPGLSREEASEYVSGHKTKNLPEHAGKKVQRERQMKKGRKSC